MSPLSQRRRLRFAAGFLALLFASSSSSVAQEAEPAARLARLVRELGHASFEIRDAASEELAELGEMAEAELAAAAGDDDPEVRLRARQLLARLKVDRLWLASQVDCQVEKGKASKTLADVAAMSGNRILIGDQYGTFQDAEVNLAAGRRDFWQVVDDLCRQSGNHVRPHYDTRNPGLVVVAGKPGRHPTAYAGPIRAQILAARRVFIEELNYEEFDSEVTHTFQLNLQMMWEDRFRLVAYRTGLEVIEAVTDTGQQLSAAQSRGSGWNVASRGTRQLSMSLRLHPPGVSARELDVLRLSWQLLAVGDWATIEVDDLDKADDYYAGPDAVKLRFQGIDNPRPGRFEVRLVVARDSLLPEPRETLFEENRFELFDADSRAFTPSGQTHRLSDEGAGYKLTFTAGQADGKPAQLRLTYPRIRSQRDAEIEFRNVPLPVAAPN